MTNPAGARVLYLQLDQRLVAAPVGTRLESGYVVVSANDRGVVVEHADTGSRLSLAADGAAPAPVPR